MTAMQSPESVAAKRRVLIDALTMCLGRSTVKNIVPIETIKTILESAAGELWREGEFRLELVWKILCQQPGLSAKEVAPPLLVFKSFEGEMGVHVRVPQALSAIPRGEQARLAEELKITKADFAETIAKMAAMAAAESAESPRADMGKAALDAAEATAPIPRAKKGPSKRQAVVAALLVTVATAALATSVWMSLRDTARPDDLADVAPILQLTDGKRVEQSLSARINDSRWETLGPDEQRRIAAQLFEHEQKKGIHSLILTDEKGHLRVSGSDAGGHVLVLVH